MISIKEISFSKPSKLNQVSVGWTLGGQELSLYFPSTQGIMPKKLVLQGKEGDEMKLFDLPSEEDEEIPMVFPLEFEVEPKEFFPYTNSQKQAGNLIFRKEGLAIFVGRRDHFDRTSIQELKFNTATLSELPIGEASAFVSKKWQLVFLDKSGEKHVLFVVDNG